MDVTTDTSRSAGLRIFFSHKRSDEDIAKKMVKKLRQFGGSQLRIFLSADMPFGEHWDDRIAEELNQAEWLFLLYTDPDLQWDWCLYEAGYFAGQKPESKRLFTLSRIGEAPKPLMRWTPVQATKEHWTRLLTDLYRGQGVNPSLDENLIASIADELLALLEKPPRRVKFGSKLRIVVDRTSLEKIKRTSGIPADAIVIMDPDLAEVFRLRIDGPRSWADVESFFPDPIPVRFGAALATISRGQALDSPLVPVDLPSNPATGMFIITGFEENASYLSMNLSFSRTHRDDVWPTRVFAAVSHLQQHTAGLARGAANHLRYVVDEGVTAATKDITGWREEYPRHREMDRTLRLIDLVRSAAHTLHAVTVDKDDYLIRFWNDRPFRRAYSRLNDLAAMRRVAVYRLFVVDDATFDGIEEKKCGLLKEIIMESEEPMVHEYLVRLSDANQYKPREVRSCLVCDEWLTSEASGAVSPGYVAADATLVAELRSMFDWLLVKAASVSQVEWLR